GIAFDQRLFFKTDSVNEVTDFMKGTVPKQGGTFLPIIKNIPDLYCVYYQRPAPITNETHYSASTNPEYRHIRPDGFVRYPTEPFFLPFAGFRYMRVFPLRRLTPRTGNCSLQVSAILRQPPMQMTSVAIWFHTTASWA